MEQNNKVMTAVVALIALVVGVFVGMGMSGGGGLQGKLSLTSEKGYTQCEEYKTMYVTGVITETLGQEEATKVMVGCGNHYPSFWNAIPSTIECNNLADRVNTAGAAKFSDFIKQQKLSYSNIAACSKQYPFLWFGTKVSEAECYNYKLFMKSGGDITKLLKNKLGTVYSSCKSYWEEIVEPKSYTCPDGSPAPCIKQKPTPIPSS